MSEVPGTTRDAIELLVDEEPWPLRFVDTAGLRASADAVERLGVEVSERRLAVAHLVLVCADTDAALEAACVQVASLSSAPRIAVRTKEDLVDVRGAASARPAIASAVAALAVSAATGAGLPALRTAIRDVTRGLEVDPVEELPIITRARHVAALRGAQSEVSAFIESWQRDALPAPVAATHLRAAVHALDELLGGIDIDEVLARVFRTFCVGK